MTRGGWAALIIVAAFLVGASLMGFLSNILSR